MLAATVRQAAERFGDRPAFVDPDGTPLTYADLDRRTDDVALGLAARGVGEGDVVALTLASDTAYVLAYVAASKLGAVAAGVNPRLTAVEQQRCLDVADPAAVLADRADVRDLEAAGAARREAGDRLPELPPDPERVACIVFTSGTTGLPKGAWFCERQLAAVARIDTGNAWGDPDQPPVPMLAATQFAHVGFMTKLPWYLRLGTTTHLLARWRAADVLDLAERVRLPSLGGVAPQVALLLRDPDLARRDLSSVRTIIMGGGPSSPALVRAARDAFGADYSIRYSSTESGGCGTGTAFDADDHEALHTVGRPRGGIEVSIHADDGSPLPEGEVGEVWLRSPAVMSGYWRDPEATAAALTSDGWLRTGDLGRLEPDGCLVLAGRSKELYIRGGYNVYPAEVEAVLEQHPALHQVALVPRPDDVMGEIGVAVVVPADPALTPDLDELRAFGGRELAAYKLPEALHVVDELPLTAMQKLDRRRLARDLSGNIDRP